MNIRHFFAIGVLAASVSGCASIPQGHERTSLEFHNQSMSDSWAATPAKTYIDKAYNIEVQEPGLIPDRIKSKKVHIHASAYLSPDDLIFILDKYGVNAVVSSKEIENAKVYVPRYSGTVGELLDIIASASDLDFRYVGNSVVIDDSKQFIVKIEQQKDLADKIASTVEKMGAEEVVASTESGTITYSASSKNQVLISNYLERLALNSSVIQLQVAVITVRLKDERNTGFNWSEFAMGFGNSRNIDNETTGFIGRLTGSAMGLQFADDGINVAAALNMLSTYGESKTSQNLTIQTLSGVPVSLKSGDKIPYISDIPTTTNDNNTTSGLETETVETGFKIDLDALYDSDESLVTISMDLSLKSLIGFIDLSAGEQLGTITQPQVQEQALNNIVKLKAGQTAMVGGLIIENYSDNRQSISTLDKLPLGSKSMDSTRTAIFIMLRPTVTVFGGDQ